MTVRDSTPRIHVKMQDAKTIEGGYYKPDVDENGILSWTPSKEHMPKLPKSNIKGKPGYTPIKGVDYFDGAPGKNGTDANVTTENITRALGYTPADEGGVNQLKGDLTELNDTVFEIKTHEETEIIPLSFTHDGWYSDKQFYNTNDGKYASVDVNAGEVYYVKGRTLWNFSPYTVLNSDRDIIYSGQLSGGSETYNREETLTIPQNGTKLIFSAPANDTAWQSFCSCIKHTIITTKTDKVEENRTDIETIKNGLYVTEDCQENITLDWINGGFYTSNGSFASDGGYDYVLLDIVAGDRYVFDYFSIYTITYVIFDENNKVLKHGNTSGSSTWTEYNEDIIAPAGSRKLALTITSYRPSLQFNNSYVHHFYKRESSIKDYLIKELEKSNILYGKKWFATGDSFTHGSLVDPDENPIFQDGRYMGKRKTYPYFIGLRNNMEIINDGLSGSTLATIKSGDTYTTDPFSVSRYLAIPEDVDYITIWFGINDANHCALGTIEDETNATFYGAYNIVLRWIITNRPNAKVGLIVTNLSTESFRQATRDIAHKWGIPYLDMMGDYQSPPIVGGREESLGMCEEATNLRTNHFHISESNMHPTVNAHRYQSTFIEAFLRRL